MNNIIRIQTKIINYFLFTLLYNIFVEKNSKFIINRDFFLIKNIV